MATIAEFELFQEWLKTRATARKSQDGPDPNHRGVVDQNFVMPGAREFPKMVYRRSSKDPRGYQARIVESAEELVAVEKQGWLVRTKDIHALLEELAKERSGDAEEVLVTVKK